MDSHSAGAKMAARNPPAFAPGWYQVGFSDDVGPGQLKGVRFFGRTVVLFRTMSGVVAMLNGVCGHDAHPLARGAVKGECIECPVHGWLWSVEGRVTRIPYYFSGARDRTIKSWPLREVGNLIVVWYDPHGGPDGPEPTELDTGRPVYSLSTPEPVANRSPAEVSLLISELRSGLPGFDAVMLDRVGETAPLRMRVVVPCRHGAALPWLRASESSPVELEARSWGPGFHQARLHTGPLEITELSAATPVSHDKVQLFSTVSINIARGAEASAPSILNALMAHSDLASSTPGGGSRPRAS